MTVQLTPDMTDDQKRQTATSALSGKKRDCPICRTPSEGNRPYFSAADGNIVKCAKCRMLFLDIATQETDWEDEPEYLDLYVKNRDRWAAVERNVAKYTLQTIGLQEGSVLEVGLGVAAFAEEARETGLDYWCVEPYLPMIDTAVERGVLNRDNAINAPIESADLPKEKFDAIVILMVLEHLLDPVESLRNCVSALRPGGVIYVEVPNSRLFATRTRLRRTLGMTDFMHGHINFFTPASLSATFEAAGLSQNSTNVISNARRGDAQMTINYYRKSKQLLRLIYGAFSIMPVDQWLGIASVLCGRATKPSS